MKAALYMELFVQVGHWELTYSKRCALEETESSTFALKLVGSLKYYFLLGDHAFQKLLLGLGLQELM